MVSLGKFAALSPTPWILAGDKYHMELRGSPLECAGPRARRNVSLQTENVHSCCLSDLSHCFSTSISPSLSYLSLSQCVPVITRIFSSTVAILGFLWQHVMCLLCVWMKSMFIFSKSYQAGTSKLYVLLNAAMNVFTCTSLICTSCSVWSSH